MTIARVAGSMASRRRSRRVWISARSGKPVGVAARLAVPVVQPVHRIDFLNPGSVGIRDGLQEPRFLPLAVEAHERYCIAADLVLQVGQQGGRQPSAVQQVCAVVADDPGQGEQVVFAGRHWSPHWWLLPPLWVSQYARGRRCGHPQNVG
jgi:hypothetical protein